MAYYKIIGRIPADFEVVLEGGDEYEAAANAHGSIGFDTVVGFDSTEIKISSVIELGNDLPGQMQAQSSKSAAA
jgi:hypothetical protein